jgi:GTP-binding protein HflX
LANKANDLSWCAFKEFPMSSKLKSTRTTTKTIMISVQDAEASSKRQKEALQELQALVETLGHQVVWHSRQRRYQVCPKTLMGSGKLAVLKGQIEEQQRIHEEARQAGDPEIEWVIIFNEELSPTQLRTIERQLEQKVMDRNGVILDIFSRHAQTREARLQVELARLNYEMLRTRERRGQKMDQQAGNGSGTIRGRGPGEAAHQQDRRILRKRKAQLRAAIEEIALKRSQRCERREALPNVALVGYTNAGKSTWMQALTESNGLVADKLFATLTTTVRALKDQHHPRILLSDTVGFIERLPHELIASFHSTLEEARHASMLIHVVDATTPDAEKHINVTEETLQTLGATCQTRLLLFNKVDLLDPTQRQTLELMYPDAMFVSANDEEDHQRVKTAIVEHFAGSQVQESLFVPYHRHDLMPEIFGNMEVITLDHQETGSQLSVKGFAQQVDWFRERLLCAA